jgi:polyisoprenoid-binding protein YceI
LGHEHIVAVKSFTGEVRMSPDEMSRTSFVLEANANALAVVDEGISDKERKEIQSAMESKVLEVSRFPKISFRSVSVGNVKPSTNGQTLTINGDLTLHGVTNRIAVPVTMAIAPEQLLVTGEVSIKQTDFGMKPYAAAGGTIKVKDALRISFAITARSSKASAK